MKKRNGFTLIELLAVIVVLALVMIIAIPSVLKTTAAAKKESFYLYANSLYSKAVGKYTQDLNDSTTNSDCMVYDIKTDLGLSDTGSYEGWVKVSRVKVNNGKSNYTINITDNSNTIAYVKYCTVDASEVKDKGTTSCTPNKTYSVDENATSVDVKQTLSTGSIMCVNYQYGNKDKSDTLQTSATNCNATITSSTNSYDYNVNVTMKSGDYAVDNYLLTKVDEDETEEDESSSMKNFYAAIDDFKENNKNLVISEPTCDGSSGETKGVTTTKTTKVTDITTKEAETKEVTTTNAGDKGTTNVTNATTNTKRVVGVDATTTAGKGDVGITTATTKEVETTEVETTTIDVQDTSLLLNTLNVSGYDIGFSPLTFYYEIDVPNTVTSLSVSAEAATPDVTSIVIDGQNAINVGSNVIVVTLTNSETGKVSRYRIIVNRYDEYNKKVTTSKVTTTNESGDADGLPDPDLEESDATLKSLTVEKYPIMFNKDTYAYTVDVRGGEDSLIINYETTGKYAYAIMAGNEKLEDGSVITITVTSANKYYSKKYTITVHMEKKTSTSTKVLRGIAVGLGVILAGCVIIISISKAREKKMIKNKINEKKDQNVATAIPVNQNKRLTPNDYVGMNTGQPAVKSVFSSTPSNVPSTPKADENKEQTNQNNGDQNNLGN